MGAFEFTLYGEFPFARISRQDAVSIPSETNVVQTRTLDERPLNVYRLTWNNAPDALILMLERLWAQASGPIVAMDWTPPGEVSPIEVQFASNTLTTVRNSAVLGSATVELVQVR